MFATAVAYLYMFPVSDFESTVRRADNCSSNNSSAGGDCHQSPKMYSDAAQNQMGSVATDTLSAVAMSGVATLPPEISTEPNHSGNGSSSSSSDVTDAPSGAPTLSMPTPAMTPTTSASLQTPSRRTAAATDSTHFSSHSGGGGSDGPNGSSSSSTIRGQDVGESGGNSYAFQNYGEGHDDDDDEEAHSDNSEWFESSGNSKTKSGRRHRRRSFWGALRTAVLPTELAMVGAIDFAVAFIFVCVLFYSSLHSPKNSSKVKMQAISIFNIVLNVFLEAAEDFLLTELTSCVLHLHRLQQDLVAALRSLAYGAFECLKLETLSRGEAKAVGVSRLE